jgi:hypothetical protein
VFEVSELCANVEYDELIAFCACEADIAYELVTALEEDIANDDVPNKDPIKLPVNDPVL